MGDLAEAIRASRDRADRKPQRLSVPEWGRDVYVRALSVADQMELYEGDRDPATFPVRLLLYTIVDEEGNRELTEDDFQLLAEESFPVIMRIFTFAGKLNGLPVSELEEAVRSFVPTPDGSTATS